MLSGPVGTHSGAGTPLHGKKDAMAFIAFDNGPAYALPYAGPQHELAPFGAGGLDETDRADQPASRLSALEWLVVALARKDSPSSLRRPGRLAAALRTLFKHPNPVLADERLEALRRIAVLSWRRGYSVPAREVAAFLAAGFTAEQYETMLASIAVARESDGLRTVW